jgi:hypothetical protein
MRLCAHSLYLSRSRAHTHTHTHTRVIRTVTGAHARWQQLPKTAFTDVVLRDTYASVGISSSIFADNILFLTILANLAVFQELVQVLGVHI